MADQSKESPTGCRKPRQEPKDQRKKVQVWNSVKRGTEEHMGQNEEPSFDS